MSTFDSQVVAESGGHQFDKNGKVLRSSKGAVGIAQVLPTTGPEAARDAGLPWDPVRFEQDKDYNRALGAAYKAKLLRMFNGDDRKATAAYNAGPGNVHKAIAKGGGNWEVYLPDETKQYLHRVTGTGVAGDAPTATTIEVPHPTVPTIDELLTKTPAELFSGVDADIKAACGQHPSSGPSVEQRVKAGLVGDTVKVTQVDGTPVHAEDAMQAAEQTHQHELDGYTTWDRIKAGFGETLAGELVDTLGQHLVRHEEDPAFQRRYLQNWQQIESFAKTDEEVSMLRDAHSDADLAAIKQHILDKREQAAKINSSDHPIALRLTTGLLDPVGIAAGFGVGKAFELAGVGSRALYLAGRPGWAMASAAGEGAVGNVAITAGLDATGDYQSAADYGTSALMGLGIGLGLGGLHGIVSRDAIATQQVASARQAREAYVSGIRDSVAKDMPDATPEEVAQETNKRVTKGYLDVLQYALADIPEDQRIMVPEDILTQNEAFQKKVAEANDLGSVSDLTEQAMVTETVARSERIVAATPIDEKALQTVLSKVGQEATSTRLLLSKSPVAKAVGITLLENGQGGAGRQRSAAITAAVRERVYNEQFSGYDALAGQYRQKEGINLLRDAWDGKARNEFNRRVFREIESRGRADHIPDDNPFVKEAADLFQAGMEKMRLEQQHVGTVGSLRLGDTSEGYVPHRLDKFKVLAMRQSNPEQYKRVVNALSGQFQDTYGWDTAFSDKLAAKYLERGLDAANGRYAVPFNLHSPEAGQMVRDALQAMGIAGEDLQKALGKFSRGGAGHTKKRLKLDLDADIGDGKKLMDIFVTDVPALYRSYARRVAGEVSLAQYGVMGKKGLEVLKTAMIHTGATPEEVKSFDQIAAEFLNTPFGEHNHAMMDNARLLTSASRLGGMAFTQFAEFGNAIPSLGVQAALRGVASMGRMASEVRAIAHGERTPNPILKSIDQFGGGVGMDDYYMTRMFDVRDSDVELSGSSMGVFSRAARAGAHANMIVSGHRMILSAQTRSMAEEILRKAVKYARDGKADTALDDMGIHQGLRDAIRADLDRIATFDGKGRLTALDLTQGKALKPHMVAEIAQAVERGASQIIQRSYHGETGAWAHDGFIKLLAQFRTFSIISVEKQWGRNLRNYGALKSFMYLTAAASFALPIHYARLQTKLLSMDPAKRDQYWKDNTHPLALARATLNYASSAGLSGDIMDVGASWFSNYGGDMGESLGDNYGIRGKQSNKLVGGVVAPAVGLANDLYAGASSGDLHKIARSLPGSNLPYVTPFVTAANEAMTDGQ